MSHIKISDLSLRGSNLFDDSESFLQDLSDQKLLAIHGGGSIISQVTVSVGLLVAPDQTAPIGGTALNTGLSDTEPIAIVFVA